MPNLNKVFLIGHLGHELELRQTSGGTEVVNFSMATTKRWKDQDSGSTKQKTEWHRVVAFGQTAKYLAQYEKKGSQVHVEGSLQAREWTDKEGVRRYTTEVVSRLVQLLGKRPVVTTEPFGTEEPPSADVAEIPEEDIPF